MVKRTIPFIYNPARQRRPRARPTRTAPAIDPPATQFHGLVYDICGWIRHEQRDHELTDVPVAVRPARNDVVVGIAHTSSGPHGACLDETSDHSFIESTRSCRPPRPMTLPGLSRQEARRRVAQTRDAETRPVESWAPRRWSGGANYASTKNPFGKLLFFWGPPGHPRAAKLGYRPV